MFRLLLVTFVSFVPFVPAIQAYDLEDIPVTRWIDDGSGARPGTYEEYQAAHPVTPWRIKCELRAPQRDDRPIDLIVNAVLYDSIRPQLDTWQADLAQEGFAVSVFTATGGTPESLRAFLVAEYAAGMQGAILVGTLPVAWYQMIDDWNNNGRRDPDEGYEAFPCDLYYMDLDGTWLDTMQRYGTRDSLIPGTDGRYDQHTGDDPGPEIWLGRITAKPCGREPLLAGNYLAKVHDYRCGDIVLSDRALVFVDDDWSMWAPEYDWNVSLTYPERILICDNETTTTMRYRTCLTENYQWIALYSHSGPLVHAMKYNNGNTWSWFYEQEVPSRNPVANFYNLFACSNARYTDTGYMAGRYIYSTTTGLNSIGSTKTGSMLQFAGFYEPLGLGASTGEAFASWFSLQAEDGITPVERSWYYGMCLNGDPTLRTRLQPHDAAVTELLAPARNVDSGQTIVPACRITNFGTHDETFTVRYRIGPGYTSTRTKTLPRSVADTVLFDPWTADSCGTFTTQCSTRLDGDTRPENDAYNWWVTVRPAQGIAETDPRGLRNLELRPNPATGAVTLRYALTGSTPQRLTLYDIRGARVKTVQLAPGPSRTGTTIIPLVTDHGRRLAPGIYLLRFTGPEGPATRRLVVR